MTTTHAYYQSPIGQLLLTAQGRALSGLYFSQTGHPPAAGTFGVEDQTHFLDVFTQLDGYFAGKRIDFSVSLATNRGTEFQNRVWAELMHVPYGQTWSYGALAKAIGQPTASRAVGLANGQNPISIIVPCHRIIGASGKLTGYGGGLKQKAWLLDHEARYRLTAFAAAGLRREMR
jgi:methylated-DNA-[protein]-cysteine S-methyltransferase